MSTSSSSRRSCRGAIAALHAPAEFCFSSVCYMYVVRLSLYLIHVNENEGSTTDGGVNLTVLPFHSVSAARLNVSRLKTQNASDRGNVR
eukprot:scaffold3361_cov153-Isochrysis_galbana.AAC.2